MNDTENVSIVHDQATKNFVATAILGDGSVVIAHGSNRVQALFELEFLIRTHKEAKKTQLAPYVSPVVYPFPYYPYPVWIVDTQPIQTEWTITCDGSGLKVV